MSLRNKKNLLFSGPAHFTYYFPSILFKGGHLIQFEWALNTNEK